MERNRDLIKEYPWLCPCLGDNGEIPEGYDYHYTLIDLLPSGWHDLILKFCADLKELLVKHDLVDKYRVAEAKEKWFMLNWNDYLVDENDYLMDRSKMPQEIIDLVNKYEERSTQVCVLCGRNKRSNRPCCLACATIYS